MTRTHFEKSETYFTDKRGIANLLRKYLVPIFVVGLGAALLVWAYGANQPKQYASVTFLKLDDKSTAVVDAVMSAEPLLDRVVAKLAIEGDTKEERWRTLSDKRNLVYVGGGLARMVVTDAEPERAKRLSNAFIDCYLDFTKPGPVARAQLEEEIGRREKEFRLAGAYLDKLNGTHFEVIDGLLQRRGQSQTSGLVGLVNVYEESAATLERLQYRLYGETRDVLLSEPTLPQEPNPQQNSIWLVLAAEVILVLWIVLREKLRMTLRFEIGRTLTLASRPSQRSGSDAV